MESCAIENKTCFVYFYTSVTWWLKSLSQDILTIEELKLQLTIKLEKEYGIDFHT